MSDNTPVSQKPLQIISLGATGLAIGWLVGLSLSPVVGTVIAAVLGLVGGVVAGFASQDGPKHVADARLEFPPCRGRVNIGRLMLPHSIAVHS